VSEPREAVVLVDHQVERPMLMAIPARVQNGRAAPTATDDPDAVDRRLALGTFEVVCEPDNLVPASH
jgi:hypothetical protein